MSHDYHLNVKTTPERVGIVLFYVLWRVCPQLACSVTKYYAESDDSSFSICYLSGQEERICHDERHQTWFGFVSPTCCSYISICQHHDVYSMILPAHFKTQNTQK